MKAMLLAAGRGERMRPLTDRTPKPLLVAGGKPLIVWHLEKLAAAGITEVIINHAWLGEQIPAALGDGSAYGVHITYSAEGEALETAGGIARALPLLTQGEPDNAPFAVISSDAWSDLDYTRLTEVAQRLAAGEGDCWCLMVDNPGHHRGGDFALDNGHLKLAGTAHKASAGNNTQTTTSPEADALTYAGIGVFTPAMFDGLAHTSGLFWCAVLHDVNQRERRFAFSQIVAEMLARLCLTAGVVEYIVDELEGRAQMHTVLGQLLLNLSRGAADNGAQPRRRLKQLGGLVSDDLQIAHFVDIGVVAIH